jgi:spore germination protein GerM
MAGGPASSSRSQPPPMNEHRRRWKWAAAAWAALGLAACGIPSSDTATRVAAGRVPFGLAEPDTATTTSNPPGKPLETVTLYYLRQNRLAAVTRRITQALALDDVLQLLSGGASETEAASGIRSALTGTSDILSGTVVRGTAVVAIGPDFITLPASEQSLAIAQIVYTATQLPGVGQVQFTNNGVPIDVPRGDGSLTIAPVTRDDYPSVAPKS